MMVRDPSSARSVQRHLNEVLTAVVPEWNARAGTRGAAQRYDCVW